MLSRLVYSSDTVLDLEEHTIGLVFTCVINTLSRSKERYKVDTWLKVGQGYYFTSLSTANVISGRTPVHFMLQ